MLLNFFQNRAHALLTYARFYQNRAQCMILVWTFSCHVRKKSNEKNTFNSMIHFTFFEALVRPAPIDFDFAFSLLFWSFLSFCFVRFALILFIAFEVIA